MVETSEETHRQAWLQVAEEFKFRKPLGQHLRRIKGVRDEVVVSRIFGWTHNPSVARQVAQRKGEIYESIMGGRQLAAMLETRPFLETLKRYSIPVALATPLSEAKVKEGLQRHNLAQYFDAVVTAEDSGSAEVEFYYAFAASKIQRPPIRCVVVGESNTSVEAAHELGMKCVVVTGASEFRQAGSALPYPECLPLVPPRLPSAAPEPPPALLPSTQAPTRCSTSRARTWSSAICRSCRL